MDINLGFDPHSLRLFFVFSSLSIMLLALGSALMVLRANPKPAANRYYSCMSLAIAFWAFCHFLWLFSFYDTPARAQRAAQWLSLGSLWIPVFHYCWIIYLLGEENIRHLRIMRFLVWIFTIVLTPFVFTSYYVAYPVLMPFGVWWPQITVLHEMFLGMYFIFPGYAIWRAIHALPRVGMVKQKQLRIIIILSIVGFVGGVTNYPQWFGVDIWPWGHPLVGLYVLMITYAMVRYRLMDIETVIHKTLLYTLASSVIFIPVGVFMFLFHPFLKTLNWYQLGLLFTLMFFLVKAYYGRLQPRIDHLFRRRKYDYQFLLREIPSHIAGILDIDMLSSNLLDTISETLYPEKVILLVAGVGQDRYVVQESRSVGHTTLEKEAFILEKDGQVVQYCRQDQRLIERDVVQADPQYASVREALLEVFARLDIQLLVPLIISQEEKLVGFLGLGRRENLQHYTIKDTDLLFDISGQIAVAIDNALYHRDILEKQGLLQQIALAKELQSSLLPLNPPGAVGGMKVFGLLYPAKEVGGDSVSYTHLTLPTKRIV